MLVPVPEPTVNFYPRFCKGNTHLVEIARFQANVKRFECRLVHIEGGSVMTIAIETRPTPAKVSCLVWPNDPRFFIICVN